MKTILYKKDLPNLTRKMTQGNIDGHTFVRRNGINESFAGIKIKDFTNREDATFYLKELFIDYADEFPDVFADSNWLRLDSIKLFPMINKWSTDNNIPYAGWQRSDGDRYGAFDRLYVWLPVRVAGEFSYLCSNSGGKRASFYCGCEGDANLSVSFTKTNTIHKTIKLQLQPVATEKTVVVSNLVQEELDNRDGLLKYLNNYESPRGYEVTDFTILD